MDSKLSMGSKITLMPHQVKALGQLHSGSLLKGGVGSGKTLTSLQFYKDNYIHRRLIVITTAKKRDTGDWYDEAKLLDLDIADITVDSWNNIKGYTHLINAFFIFDEQRALDFGAWGTAFIDIAHQNEWIMLSATPADVWKDYAVIFVANNFYKNKSDFIEQHIEYNRFVKFPSIKKYHNVNKLVYLRNKIVVEMNLERHTIRHRRELLCSYDKEKYKYIMDNLYNPYLEQPMKSPAELSQVLRRLVATSPGRIDAARFVMSVVPRLIVFYNLDYERDILLELCKERKYNYAEWNGHKHQSIPETDNWIYIVQYTAGAEGWNCIDTDTILYYSRNYSFRLSEQSEGRIDRLNTPYTHLEYIYLSSKSEIDQRVKRSVNTKKKFNEAKWGRKYFERE